LIPASGAGTRFMWHPCRGSLRFGRAPVGAGATSWDDANQDDFTFAGGNQVIASDYGAFAYGDQVTVTSTVGVGFGSGVLVSGTAGFSAGAQNMCGGFACTAIGYTVGANGQGSTALGYRTLAGGDYTTALGYRATTCIVGIDPSTQNKCALNGGNPTSYTGSFVWGDESSNGANFSTNFVNSQADNEFRIRANGGIRLRVSTAANGNTPGAGGNVGCDLTFAVPSWTCASSRDVKENFKAVKGEQILSQLRNMPVLSFNYIDDKTKTRSMGPVAEDFYKAFRLGDNDKSINFMNMAGVSLAGVKALEERTAKLQQENDQLKATIASITARLNRMEKRSARKSVRRTNK
jgi:trimeric autotransporter adhesin